MSDFLGDLDKLSQKASYFIERTKIIQGNIANADTPNYKPKDITFEEVLTQQTKMKIDNPKHMNPFPEKSVHYKVITGKEIEGYDGNKVNVEKEMAKLAESSIMYKSLAEALKKEISKMKLVISGR